MLVLVIAIGAGRADATPAASPPEVADRLVQRWAPVYVQHVDADDRGADRPTRVDFDGNWDTTDNWDRQARFGAALPPAVYGAAILTDTHAYLTYSLYYPRDWDRRICAPFLCHDNDLETIQLVVERGGGGDGDGRLVEVRVKAHLRVGEVDGVGVARAADGRPLLRVESGGHGIAVCRPGEPACAARPGRLVYAPGSATAEPPARAAGQTVRYQLLPLYATLWARRHLDHRRLWTDGETGPLFYRGRRMGRLGHPMGAAMAGSRFLGGVRPPWAIKGSLGARGDWFLDPAGDAAASRYEFNPFLDDLAAECRGRACAPGPRRERTRAEYLVKLAAPYLVAALVPIAVHGWRRRREGPPPSGRHTIVP
ncbi:MAG TPA: hypothetical protein VM734_06625 [Kofleriaceae bacterium]|nr:hypothetical protein [Kofleriaceae bacterium]